MYAAHPLESVCQARYSFLAAFFNKVSAKLNAEPKHSLDCGACNKRCDKVLKLLVFERTRRKRETSLEAAPPTLKNRIGAFYLFVLTDCVFDILPTF
ncbi:MAG TPA: hypothetical protein VGG51_05005 [Candidatus Cybelea sp.]